VFGEMSHLLQKSTGAEVVASGPASVHVADNPEEFLIQNPDAMYYIAQILAARLAEMNQCLLSSKREYADRESDLGILDIMVDRIMAGHPEALRRD
jgi:hypothetical protein